MTAYVLIHGAFHGGWCWKRVARSIRAAGREVYTPTLTGLGERAHLLTPEIGLETHIQDILGMLEYEDLHEVVLVGHSYGGMVITGVAEKCPERLSQLVFLDAFIPKDGQALIELFPPEMAAKIREQTRSEGQGYRLPPSAPEIFGVTTDEDLAWVKPRLSPQPIKTYLDPVHISNPFATQIPHVYIYCIHPHSLLEQFVTAIRSDKSWQYYEITAGHDAMIVEPDKLSQVLLTLAPAD